MLYVPQITAGTIVVVESIDDRDFIYVVDLVSKKVLCSNGDVIKDIPKVEWDKLTDLIQSIVWP